MLLAFSNDENIKKDILRKIDEWIEKKKIPNSPEILVSRILSTERVFDPPDIILEDYELYPKELGLPLWLAYLNRTIHHHNSNDFYYSHGHEYHYEFEYYKDFINCCNVGIDYSKLLYKWQLFILTDLVKKHKNLKSLDCIIDLFSKAALNTTVSIDLWINAQKKIEIELNKYDADSNDGTWDLLRAAYLSADEIIDIENIYTSSVEAIVDAKLKYDGFNPKKLGNDIKIKDSIWKTIMNHLLLYLREWNIELS